MSCDPNVRIRIELCNVCVKIKRLSIVSIFIFQCLDCACIVAGVGRGLTVTDLPPGILSSLTTTATEKQIVIEFVIRSCLSAVKQGTRGSLDGNNNCAVVLISINVSS
jgi:hypothetical protein